MLSRSAMPSSFVVQMPPSPNAPRFFEGKNLGVDRVEPRVDADDLVVVLRVPSIGRLHQPVSSLKKLRHRTLRPATDRRRDRPIMPKGAETKNGTRSRAA